MKLKGKYLYLLLMKLPNANTKAEYEGITLGWFNTDTEALIQARKNFYLKDADTLMVRTIATAKLSFELVDDVSKEELKKCQ